MFRDTAAWKGLAGAYRVFPSDPYKFAAPPVVYDALTGACGSGGGSFLGADCGPALGLWRAESRMLSVAALGFRATTWSFFSFEGTYRVVREFFPTLPYLLAFSGDRTISGQG